VIERRYIGVKKIQFVTKVPIIRELTTVQVAAILTR
jgi:hypothetical protein